jgi:hypothetical protein
LFCQIAFLLNRVLWDRIREPLRNCRHLLGQHYGYGLIVGLNDNAY